MSAAKPLMGSANVQPSNVGRKGSRSSAKAPIVKRFEDMGLQEGLLRGIFSCGFERPSAIQQRAIPAVLRGRDLIAQSQSGTGKTAVFCIGSLQCIRPSLRKVQVLILSPTRELALQTEKVVQALGNYLSVKSHACIGGTSVGSDTKKLQAGVQLVSGTPGRVFDLIRRRHLETDKVRLLVIDEADEILEMGFKEQIYDIFRRLPSQVQVVLISATLSPEVLAMTTSFMSDPVRVLVRRDDVTLDGIKQYYVDIGKEEWKFEALCDIYDSVTVSQAVIFCNTRKKVDWLSENLRQSGFTVASMHGDMQQVDRDKVMAIFRSGKSRVLVTTDIWGRGIDVQQISLVVNYDMPLDKANYVHRIGRSGRFGRKGLAINFVTQEDKAGLKALMKHYATTILPLPGDLAGL